MGSPRNAEYRRRHNRGMSRNRRITNKMVRDERFLEGCMDCGEMDPIVLTFDHVQGKKIFDLSNSLSVSAIRYKQELDKCDVVCANCHMRRTHARKQVIINV